MKQTEPLDQYIKVRKFKKDEEDHRIISDKKRTIEKRKKRKTKNYE